MLIVTLLLHADIFQDAFHQAIQATAVSLEVASMTMTAMSIHMHDSIYIADLRRTLFCLCRLCSITLAKTHCACIQHKLQCNYSTNLVH